MHRLHFPLERTADQKELDNLHLYTDDNHIRGTASRKELDGIHRGIIKSGLINQLEQLPDMGSSQSASHRKVM